MHSRGNGQGEIKIGKTEEKRNTQRKEETKEYENRQ